MRILERNEGGATVQADESEVGIPGVVMTFSILFYADDGVVDGFEVHAPGDEPLHMRTIKILKLAAAALECALVDRSAPKDDLTQSELGMTDEQFRHAQFMGGIGDEEWD